ncbi:MAG: LysR family transcriptional regulator, partial [Chloroflexi bacterium]
MSIEDKLEALGSRLPPAPVPVASYVPAVRTGNLIFTSGQIPMEGGQLLCKGQVDQEIGEEDARAAARLAALNCLSVIKSVIGNLDRIVRVIKLTGFVNSTPGYVGQSGVVNGASDFLLEVFGEAGHHARSTVGVPGLPLGAAVEIEMIVEV